MGAIFRLSMRQLAGGRVRVAIILIAAALPVAIAAITRIFTGADDAGDAFVEAAIVAVVTPLVLPIITMAMGTAAFGEEIEDRTLSYLTMKPVARVRVVLAKYLAVVAVVAPVLVVSGVAVALLGNVAEMRPLLALAAGLTLGVAAYGALFLWMGLMMSRGLALGLGLVYLFLWEGVASGLLEGIRYGSVRAYTISLIYGLDRETFAGFDANVIGVWAAAAGTVLAAGCFLALTVVRLRRMDVP